MGAEGGNYCPDVDEGLSTTARDIPPMCRLAVCEAHCEITWADANGIFSIAFSWFILSIISRVSSEIEGEEEEE